ncbi:hypothetical protein CRENBAI_006831 [Crenichthys baileyi]|uniref:Uncharacterized protein n=1 Tax=Crenichthys baileyi TaxID=28760 RepID=A0AAV9R1C3_9TELE
MPDPDVLRVAEVYQDFAADLAPLITTWPSVLMSPLVDSAFWKVQKAVPYCFHHIHYQSAELSFATWMPLSTAIALDNYHLEPTSVQFVCTHQQQLELGVSRDNAVEQVPTKFESATREQSTTADGHNVRQTPK